MEMQQLEIADEDDDIGGSRPGQRFLSGGGPCRVHDMSALDVGRGYDPYDLWRDVVVDVVDVCIDEGGEETQICLHCLFGFTLSFLGFFLVSFFLSLSPLFPIILPDKINISCVYCVPFARFPDQCNSWSLSGNPQRTSMLPAGKI